MPSCYRESCPNRAETLGIAQSTEPGVVHCTGPHAIVGYHWDVKVLVPCDCGSDHCQGLKLVDERRVHFRRRRDDRRVLLDTMPAVAGHVWVRTGGCRVLIVDRRLGPRERRIHHRRDVDLNVAAMNATRDAAQTITDFHRGVSGGKPTATEASFKVDYPLPFARSFHARNRAANEGLIPQSVLRPRTKEFLDELLDPVSMLDLFSRPTIIGSRRPIHVPHRSPTYPLSRAGVLRIEPTDDREAVAVVWRDPDGPEDGPTVTVGGSCLLEALAELWQQTSKR